MRPNLQEATVRSLATRQLHTSVQPPNPARLNVLQLARQQVEARGTIAPGLLFLDADGRLAQNLSAVLLEHIIPTIQTRMQLPQACITQSAHIQSPERVQIFRQQMIHPRAFGPHFDFLSTCTLESSPSQIQIYIYPGPSQTKKSIPACKNKFTDTRVPRALMVASPVSAP